MKNILDIINEANNGTTTYYAVKFVSGKEKDNYLGDDGAMWATTKIDIKFGYGKTHPSLYETVEEAEEALASFVSWDKNGNWGKPQIFEITLIEKEIK